MMTNFLPKTAVPFRNAYVVNVTPALALTWLESSKSDRPIFNDRVQKLAAEMKDGQWRANHNGIAFAEDGTLLDGLHRLFAVVCSGMTVPMMVVVDEPVENMDVIDNRNLSK